MRATDRLSDFKLGMGVVVKGIRTGAALGGLKLQCFAIATFSIFIRLSVVFNFKAVVSVT